MQLKKGLSLLGRIWRLPWQKKLLLTEALIWLTIARIAHMILPFRHFIKVYGVVNQSSPQSVGQDISFLASGICTSIMRVAAVLPFETRCLPQSFAAQMMLSRRRISTTTYLGVHKDRKQRYSGISGSVAHAWVRVGEKIVIGGDTASDFTPVAQYSRSE
ncbi:lasso peptide biosynthesis B2 protein [Parasphingorhabdus sp.]